MSASPDTESSFLHASPYDKGPAIIVSAYILVITSLLSTAVRLIEVVSKTRAFHLPDALIVAANVSRTYLKQFGILTSTDANLSFLL